MNSDYTSNLHQQYRQYHIPKSTNQKPPTKHTATAEAASQSTINTINTNATTNTHFPILELVEKHTIKCHHRLQQGNRTLQFYHTTNPITPMTTEPQHRKHLGSCYFSQNESKLKSEYGYTYRCHDLDVPRKIGRSDEYKEGGPLPM